MKRHFNTLFITTRGCLIKKERETLVVRTKTEKLGQFPLSNLESLVLFGGSRVTPPLMQYCAIKNISISFLSVYGRFYARVLGPQSGNVLLRKEQYRFADNSNKSLEYAKYFIRGKIKNANNLIKRTIRNYPSGENINSLKEISLALKKSESKIGNYKSLEEFRGLEGHSAREYFKAFAMMIQNKDPLLQFDKRTKYPPLDTVNCMLSFVYTLLMHDIRSALETIGLDPYVGFLHRDRPGRASLALDLMEEFRPYLADRLVLRLINKRQISSKDFKYIREGVVVVKDKLKKQIIQVYQKRKNIQINHPVLNEKVTIGVLPFIQAQLLARKIRGDMIQYPSIIFR